MTTTTTINNNANAKAWRWAASAALAAAAAALGGCKSSDKHETQVDQSADLTDQNRVLVRIVMAENVYNGVAAERAVYPKDFEEHSATLNNLGVRRVETLVDASRNSTAPVVVIRGDAPDELYASRVATVRKELIAAGLAADDVTIAQDTHVGGGTVSSDRALLTFQRLMSDYLPKPQQPGAAAGSGSLGAPAGSPSAGSNGSNSNQGN